MYIEVLAKQGKEKLREGLASIEPAKLIQLRKEQVRNCFMSSVDMGNRFSSVVKISGVEYINDAMSSSPNATWFSLEMMTKPVIWITYGHTSDEELSSLIPVVREKVDTLICIGSNIESVAKVFAGIVKDIASAQTIEDAVNYAHSIVDEEKAVLFSPACQLSDNQEHGSSFRRYVNEL